MKHLKLFFALFAMLALGVGNAWAEEVTETITMKNFGGLTTGSLIYQTKPGLSDKGTGMVAFAFNPTTGQVRGNKTGIVGASVTIDQKSHNWSLYNSDPMAGVIKAIKVTQTATGTNKFQNNLYVSLGTSSQGEVTAVTNAQKQDAGGTAQEINFTIDPSKGYTYFKLLSNEQFTSGTVVGVIVTVTYETAGGGVTPDPDPTPDPTQYTIKWHTAKGVTTDVTLNEGATITKPATDPTMTDYEFMGWTEDCAVAPDGADFTAITDFGTATEDKDYYAVFAKATTTGGGGTTTETLKGSDVSYSGTNGYVNFTATTTSGTWSGKANYNKNGYIQINKNNNNYHIGSPTFASNVTSIKITTTNNSAASRTFYICSSNSTAQPSSGDLGSHKTTTQNESFTIDLTKEAKQFYIYSSGAVYISQIDVTFAGGTTTYSDYITTCASGIEYVELGDDFKWSATEAEVTIDATDNVFPTLTNTHNVPVTYSSSDDAIATIADGTVTLKKEGTVTITAKYAGGTSAGTGKEYKSKTVTYSLKVNKAAPVASGTTYVKVTSTAGITDGEYLIVYEDAEGNPKAPVAFDGSLAPVKLDVASNNIEVSITSNTIAGNTDIDAATFTINTTAGTIQTKDGYYIGQTSNANGLATSTTTEYTNTISIENDGSATIISSGGAYLRYNSANDNLRFRYFKSSTYTAQKAIALYKKVDPNAVVEPVFTLAAGEYYGTQSVEITCATAGAEIYYTLDETEPTSASTKYTDAISIASTTTIKAVAIKGENSSAVVSATYTILAPLATMQEIFDKATDATQSVHIKFNDWVISGVVPGKDEKPSSNAYITDGSKGFIIYTKDGHGFNVGDKLSGTIVCDLTRYNGSAEVVGLTSSTTGLSVTTGGVVTPVEVADESTLSGVNTGAVIKITGPCTVDGTKYYVAGVQLYNSLYTYTNPEEGYNYECTGVYLQYNTTKEILPRKAEDLVKIETQQPAGISFAVTELTAEVGATDFEEPELTNPNSLTVTYKTSDATLATINATTGEVTIGNKAGKVTITASFAGSDDFVAADASYNITITDPSISTVTFDATIDKTPDAETLSLTKDVITMTFTGGAMNNGENYRCYKNQTLTISAIDASIQKIEFECTSSNPISGFADATGLDKTNSVWTGDAKSIELTASNNQVRMSKVNVYYKKDNRADAGLAWNPATVSLTVGDAFTAPTFSNPNGLTVSFESSNTDLATVNNAGVISLVSGKTGTATITATYAGNETYKPAEVTCTITVDHKSEDVVILAKCKDQYYALVAEYVEGKTDVLQALPVEYVGGKIYNVETEDQASIIWKRVVVDGKTTFQNGDNYLSAVSSPALKLEEEACDWIFENDMYKIEGADRTILYYATTGGFKNYSIGNMSPDGVAGEYSSNAITVAPVFADGDAYHRTTTPEKFGTICLPFGATSYTGMELYEFVGKEEGKADLASVTTLEAGVPYIFLATANELAVYSDGTTVTEAGSHNGLHGTFTNDTEVAVGNYILKDNKLCQAAEVCYVNANRAYIVWGDIPTGAPQQMPGRKYISMDVQGENETTSVEDLFTTDAPVKVVENAQLIIIRNGEKYNVQGVRL